MAKSEKKNRLLKLDPADASHASESLSAPTRSSVGADLLAARNERNISLKKVSEDTHISLRHLENLEAGSYSELPGGMYNRAFLRSYCSYLGLPPEEFLDRFQRESAPQAEKAPKPKAKPQPLPSPPIRIPSLLIWSVMLLVSIGGLYFSRGWISSVFSPYFSRPPATRIPVPPQTPAAQPPKEIADATATPATGAGTDPTTDQAKPAITPPPADAPPPGTTIRIEFETVQDCWMSLTGDGERVYTGVLKPGDTPHFDARETFTVVLGNAGGIRLKINGKPAKPLGAPGSVLKILINAETIPDLLEKVDS